MLCTYIANRALEQRQDSSKEAYGRIILPEGEGRTLIEVKFETLAYPVSNKQARDLCVEVARQANMARVLSALSVALAPSFVSAFPDGYQYGHEEGSGLLEALWVGYDALLGGVSWDDVSIMMALSI